MSVIEVTRLRDDVEIPQYATDESAGFDIAVADDVHVPYRGQVVLAHTGLVIGLPRGTFLMIVPRSSTYHKHGVSLANTIGILDHDYRGPEDELMLALRSEFDMHVKIKAGTRVAQGIVVPYVHGRFREVETNSESRGGWGSTG